MPTKILIAVHGIGEQLRGETIRAVAHQVCRYCGVPAAMPLGRFGAELTQYPGGGAGGAFVVKSPPDHPDLSPDIGFGEIYWADIARGPAGYRYTLDGAKTWAQSVAERARVRTNNPVEDQAVSRAVDRASAVIDEMAEGVQVLERLFYLTDKAGLFRFDLRDILVNYLGDVQIVTEFSNYRTIILDTFEKVMRKIHEDNPEAELYFVAHSEGSVIAFLGLLHALRRRCDPDAPLPQPEKHWIDAVRGLMTIGSPIGKHLHLWHWLWKDLENPKPGTKIGPVIQWRNYYDFGDPVGFHIRTARDWLESSKWIGDFSEDWKGNFKFETDEEEKAYKRNKDKGDFGFARYYFPGKAHTDYWTDPGVFGHFLGAVVQPPRLPPPGPPPVPPPALSLPPPPYPKRKFWATVLSWPMPFVLALLLLLFGVVIFHKAVVAWHGINESAADERQDVLGVTLLLTGITLAARIPRVTPKWYIHGIVYLFFVVSLLVFPAIVSEGLIDRVSGLFIVLAVLGIAPMTYVLYVMGFTVAMAVLLLFFYPKGGGKPALSVFLAIGLALILLSAIWEPVILALLVTAGVFVILVGFITLVWPKRNAQPLVILGVVSIVLMVLSSWFSDSPYARFSRIKQELFKQGVRGEDLDNESSEILRYMVQFTLNQLETSSEEKNTRLQEKETEKIKESADKWREKHPDVKPDTCCKEPRTSLGPVWPLLIASAIFLYFWWASAIVLDLSVIWYHYIRNDAIEAPLKEIGKREVESQVAFAKQQAQGS